MNNKRSSSQQHLQKAKTKVEILKDLNNQQQERIENKIGETPILKLGNIKPFGISLELKMRENNEDTSN